MQSIILIRYGEIGLKGKNKSVFERRLVKFTKSALSTVPGARIEVQYGRLFVHVDREFESSATEILKKVPGIFSLSKTEKTGRSIENLKTVCARKIREEIASRGLDPENTTFKIEARRADKQYPLKSPEIASIIGGSVLAAVPGIRVDVHSPDIRLVVEIRDQAYIFFGVEMGIGGMPYGSASKALALFSGGIDSPVAVYQMAKRGVEIEGVHFHSYPFTSVRAQEKLVTLAEKLSQYTLRFRFTYINLLEIQREIKEKCPSNEMTILSRCFMMLIAARIAEERDCKALVTGESIGQVASQTMESINVTNSMVDLPIFRPLISMDKSEIIEIARRIDTFETSILPFEDCCTVFLPPKVVTKPRIENIKKSLENLDVEGLVNSAIKTAEQRLINRI